MKLLFGVLLLVVGVVAEKELIDSNTEDATSLLTKRLWTQIRKRLKDYGYSDSDLDDLDKELDGEQCTYNFQNGTIIRTHDSIEAGATFINSQIGISREECTSECCSVDNCNIAVFKEKDNDHSCYLFDCGTPNICKFTRHPGYTVIELPDRTTTDKVLEKHEDDLEQLAETPTTTATTTTTTTTPVPTTTSPTQEPEKVQPVSLFGKCKQHKDCAGSWTQCLGGYCVCKDGYHEQEGTCRKDCSKFEFECRNTGQPLAYPQCVAIYNKCDGISLCKDSSDEADCDVKEDGYSNPYGQQLVNQAGSITGQQPAAVPPPMGQNQQLQVNHQAVQPQQLMPQQVANMPYQGAVQSTGPVYGEISQQYGQLNSPLQNMNNPVPLQSPGQYRAPAQQTGAEPVWAQQQQQQQQQQAMPNVYNKQKSMPAVQGQMEWNGQSQVPVQQYNSAAVQQNYPQEQNYNIGPPLEQQVQPVVSQTEKSRSHQLPYEAQPPPQRARNKGRLSNAGRHEAAALGSISGGTETQHAKQHIDQASSGRRGNKLSGNTTITVSESKSIAQEHDSKPQKSARKNKQDKVKDESGVKPDSRTEPPVGIPEEYYKQYSQPYDSSRHGLYSSYNRNRGPYNSGYLNNINNYMPEGDGYGRGDGYDLSGNPLYAGALPRNRLASGGRGQYLDYDQYFGDGMLNGLDPNVAYDYYPLDTGIHGLLTQPGSWNRANILTASSGFGWNGKKVNHLKTKHTDNGNSKNVDVDNDYTMVTRQKLPALQDVDKDVPLDSKEASVSESADSSVKDSVKGDESTDGKEKLVSDSSEDTQEEKSVTKEKSSTSDKSSESTDSESSIEKSEDSVNKTNEKEHHQADKNTKEVQSLGRVVQVVLSQEEGTKLEEADDGGNVFSGFYHSNRGAVVALSLGLCITAMLLIFIGCRLRNVKKRLRRGRPLNSNEADYLINGMYL